MVQPAGRHVLFALRRQAHGGDGEPSARSPRGRHCARAGRGLRPRTRGGRPRGRDGALDGRLSRPASRGRSPRARRARDPRTGRGPAELTRSRGGRTLAGVRDARRLAPDLRGGRARGRGRPPRSDRPRSRDALRSVRFAVARRPCRLHSLGRRLSGSRRDPWLDDVAVPTLVIGGTEDPFFGREGYRRTAASIPDARYVEFDAGHEAVIDRRREFDGAIRGFLYD
ncbi:alpha/beta fold hydrolase [Halalkalicoccus salilacus]|uniref:alpha/beta fold hydrolase n=1 Tax=Halalkalicoccus sp. GCM10025704 TaxID=3252662 RepID=UPI0036207A8B